MLLQRQVAALILACLGGCARAPEFHVPPEQRNPYELSSRKSLKHFIAVNDPDAPEHFVTDVLNELNDGSWRWVLRRPTFQLRVPTNESLKLRIDLTVPDITFQQTGPVQILVTVGPHVLDTIRFDQPETRVWEKTVPAGIVPRNETVLVALEIDKMWKSPDDGVERGFIVTKIGFVQ